MDKLWSGEGILLVKTLANSWESERSWFFGKQSRLNDLKRILEYLHSKDVEGANTLCENIANDLANRPQ
ncbi:hypothetical protein [Pleurocapsa sp. PCC 7319]|uniref:hypothetical protein n=1 Tax=Pleurocapsa sp. PCC 7319 TaxID=118161 RepID=UPI000363C274|nr:hypothetical protein [Pleurocapsa sp. PCC 7319]